MTRPPDFAASVRFLLPSRYVKDPRQGLRSDIRYPVDPPDQAWMVWPTFVDAEGVPLPAGTLVPEVTEAHFTVLNEELRESVHRARITPGARFQMIMGGPIADCVVTELLAMKVASTA